MAGKGSGALCNERMFVVLAEKGVSFEWSVLSENALKGLIKFTDEILTFQTRHEHVYNITIEKTHAGQYEFVIWKGGGVREITTPVLDEKFITKLVAQLQSLVQEMRCGFSTRTCDRDLSNDKVFKAFLQLVNELSMGSLSLVPRFMMVDFDSMMFGGSPTSKARCLRVKISDLGGVDVKGHDGATQILMHGFIGCLSGIYFLDDKNILTGPAIRCCTVDELLKGLRKTLTYTKSQCVKNALIAGLSSNIRRFVVDSTGRKMFEIYLLGKEFWLWVSVDERGMSISISYEFALKDNMEETSKGSVDGSDIHIGVKEIIQQLERFAKSKSNYSEWQCNMASLLCSRGILFMDTGITPTSMCGELTCKETDGCILNCFIEEKDGGGAYEFMMWRGGGVREAYASEIGKGFVDDICTQMQAIIRELSIRGNASNIRVHNDLESLAVFNTFKIFLESLVEKNPIEISPTRIQVDFDDMRLAGSPPGGGFCLAVSLEVISAAVPIIIKGRNNIVRVVMHGFIDPIYLPGIYFTGRRNEIIGPPIRGRSVAQLLAGLQKAIKKS
jgi:hypothetical protein